MLKLNCVSTGYEIRAYGFKALLDYALEANKSTSTVVPWVLLDLPVDGPNDEVVVSSLPPAVMAGMGIMSYYAPALPKGIALNTAQDVYDADLRIVHVSIFTAPTIDMANKVSLMIPRQGAIETYKKMYLDDQVLSGNLTLDDTEDAYVVATLTPHLAKASREDIPKDFDYGPGGDVCDPITVVID